MQPVALVCDPSPWKERPRQIPILPTGSGCVLLPKWPSPLFREKAQPHQDTGPERLLSATQCHLPQPFTFKVRLAPSVAPCSLPNTRWESSMHTRHAGQFRGPAQRPLTPVRLDTLPPSTLSAPHPGVPEPWRCEPSGSTGITPMPPDGAPPWASPSLPRSRECFLHHHFSISKLIRLYPLGLFCKLYREMARTHSRIVSSI